MPHRTAPVRLTNPLSGAPDLRGRRAVVTGGASGLGLVTARALATRGARVLLGVRDVEKGERARRRLLEEDALPDDRVEVARLDLIDLDSVGAFAASAAAHPLDLLVLNAGISSVPWRTGPGGVESQFATNHLGHFALTGHLLDALTRGSDARVVTVSSALYTGARLDVATLTDPAGYSPGRAYSRSKLATTIFAVELGRRLDAAGSPVRSLAAHPGMARTPLHSTYPSALTRLATTLVAAAIGRDPGPADVAVLAAAISPEVTPDLFWGPVGSRTRPDVAGVPFAPVATDRRAGSQLWDASQRLTGTGFLG